MNHKKGRSGGSANVLIDTIANCLPVDSLFNKDTFANLTGINKGSCQQRLKTLVKDGYLTEEFTLGMPSFYKMSIEMRLLMIERGKINRRIRGKAPSDRSKKMTSIVSKQKVESDKVEARKEHALRKLREVKFI